MFEPLVLVLARLFLVVDVGVIHYVLFLHLGLLFAEAAVLEKMLPSNFALGIDEHPEDRFVGIHLGFIWKWLLVLVGESASRVL